MLLIFIISCTQPYVVELDVQPDEQNPIVLVQLSDIHFKPGKKIYDNMVTQVNTIQPDIIVFTGDMVDDSANVDAFFEMINGISVVCAKYAILGNWEYWSNTDIDNFETKLEEKNIRLLVNESEKIIIKNRAVSIFGLDDYLGGKPDSTGFDYVNGDLNIVLAHCPILFDIVRAVKKVDSSIVMLSGHTHGGQITFFGNPLFLPEGSGEYESGFYYKDNDILYVSKGIGNSTIDIRLGANPNIDVLRF